MLCPLQVLPAATIMNDALAVIFEILAATAPLLVSVTLVALLVPVASTLPKLIDVGPAVSVVAVTMTVAVAVGVGLLVEVAVGVLPLVAVEVGVAVGVGVATLVEVGVAVGVVALVEVAVGVGVGVTPLVDVGVAVGVGVDVAAGLAPAEIGVGTPSPEIFTIETILVPAPTRRSNLPSPVRSTNAGNPDDSAIGKSLGPLKVPSPLPLQTSELAKPQQLAMARSGNPSPFRSATARPTAYSSRVVRNRAAEVTMAIAQENIHRAHIELIAGWEIRRRESYDVEVAILVDVGDRHCLEKDRRREGGRRWKASVTLAEIDLQGAGDWRSHVRRAAVGNHQVEVFVAVEIGRRQGDRINRTRDRSRRPEGAVALARQKKDLTRRRVTEIVGARYATRDDIEFMVIVEVAGNHRTDARADEGVLLGAEGIVAITEEDRQIARARVLGADSEDRVILAVAGKIAGQYQDRHRRHTPGADGFGRARREVSGAIAEQRVKRKLRRGIAAGCDDIGLVVAVDIGHCERGAGVGIKVAGNGIGRRATESSVATTEQKVFVAGATRTGTEQQDATETSRGT